MRADIIYSTINDMLSTTLSYKHYNITVMPMGCSAQLYRFRSVLYTFYNKIWQIALRPIKAINGKNGHLHEQLDECIKVKISKTEISYK